MKNDEYDESLDGLSTAEAVNRNSYVRMNTGRQKKEIFRKIFYFIFGLVLVAVVALICLIFFFGVKSVEINGLYRYEKQEIIDECGFNSSTNLFSIRESEIENLLKDKFPFIKKVELKRVLPSTVVLDVTEDAPMWYTDIDGDWFVLSRDLRVISAHDMKEEISILSMPVRYVSLPEVRSVIVGQNVEFEKATNYAYIVDFLNKMDEIELVGEVERIDASDRYHIAIYTEKGRYKITLGSADNLETKLRFVNKVITESFDENSIASIDVEYVDHIIVLEQKELFDY